MKRKSFKEWLAYVGPLGLIVRVFLVWFILVFLIFPNLNIVVSVFYKDGQFTLEAFRKFISSERAVKSLMNSLILAISLVITVNIVGTLLVLFTEYLDIKGAKILKLGYMSTLVYGGIVLATGYKYIYGANGIVTNFLLNFFPYMNQEWFQGYFAVLFIMTFACTSNHIIFLSNAIKGIDYQTVEAAKNMGASFKTIFFKVVLPVLKPTFFAVTILTFLTGIGALSAPLIVGGPNFQTINPMIITFASSIYSRDIAALLAIILGIITIILLTIMNKVEKGGNYISISKVKSKIKKEKINNPVANVIAHIIAYILFLIYALPILLVILFSFTDSATILSGQLSFSSLTLDNYKKLFETTSAFRPYLVSVVYSLLAGVLVAILATVVSKMIHKSKNPLAKGLEYSMLIPWLLPSTLIALGLLVAFNEPRIMTFNQILVGTPLILLIGYIIIRIPFSFRMIKAAFFGVEDELEESAKSMGAKPLYTFRKVILPIILPAITSVIAMNFNSLLADYDLTVFLFSPYYEPLGPVIRAASDESYNLDGKVMSFVYAVIIMLISSVALYIAFGRSGEKKNKKKKKA